MPYFLPWGVCKAERIRKSECVYILRDNSTDIYNAFSIYIRESYIKQPLQSNEHRKESCLPRPAGRRAFRRERRRKAEKATVSNAAIAQPRAALVGDLLCIYRVNMVSNSSMAWWRVDMLPFAVSPSRPLSARIRVQRRICTTVNKCVSSRYGLSMLRGAVGRSGSAISPRKAPHRTTFLLGHCFTMKF